MAERASFFVPGRICLMGEHSDWAGGFRSKDPSLSPGKVVIAGTNQGMYVRVSKREDGLFHMQSTLPGGEKCSFEVPMTLSALESAARSGDFFSYAAGTAAVLLRRHPVVGVGLDFDNYMTDLPVRKGLSSSAAICVAVARGFSQVYDLQLSVEEEMDVAYEGEILTPSRCGRMDQGCAFGHRVTTMTFDGEQMSHDSVTIAGTFNLLIVDLNAHKDTVRILADLTRCYTEPERPQSSAVREYFNHESGAFCDEAMACLARGDARGLGAVMTAAQSAFDRAVSPACPEELTSPVLHQVLSDPRVQAYTYGGKGIGSQGDGTVQVVCRSDTDRVTLQQYLKKQYNMDSFPLDLEPAWRQHVRKALIPVAGLGTRMFPSTKVVKKELLPVITPDGVCKPILQTIVEEAYNAGVTEIGIIVRPSDEKVIADLFAPADPAYVSRLPMTAQLENERLVELGKHITFIHQTEQLGFGHAVYCAREWAAGEPVLLMLGDHIYATRSGKSCARQLMEAFEAQEPKAIVSLYPAPGDKVHHYGTATGTWLPGSRRLLSLTEFAEKPSLEYASEHLAMEGLPANHFLCVYGQYILTPEVFEILGREIAENRRQKGEFQLTTALDELRAERGMYGLLVKGEHYDTGQPREYLESLVAYASLYQ